MMSADGAKTNGDENTTETATIAAPSAPVKKKSNRVRNLLKQVDPDATNSEIDSLFKVVTMILNMMEMTEDPTENLINALRKIEGQLDHLDEMREHLNKHFYNLNLHLQGLEPIHVFEKQVQTNIKNAKNERKKEEMKIKQAEHDALKRRQAEERKLK